MYGSTEREPGPGAGREKRRNGRGTKAIAGQKVLAPDRHELSRLTTVGHRTDRAARATRREASGAHVKVNTHDQHTTRLALRIRRSPSIRSPGRSVGHTTTDPKSSSTSLLSSLVRHAACDADPSDGFAGRAGGPLPQALYVCRAFSISIQSASALREHRAPQASCKPAQNVRRRTTSCRPASHPASSSSLPEARQRWPAAPQRRRTWGRASGRALAQLRSRQSDRRPAP